MTLLSEPPSRCVRQPWSPPQGRDAVAGDAFLSPLRKPLRGTELTSFGTGSTPRRPCVRGAVRACRGPRCCCPLGPCRPPRGIAISAGKVNPSRTWAPHHGGRPPDLTHVDSHALLTYENSHSQSSRSSANHKRVAEEASAPQRPPAMTPQPPEPLPPLPAGRPTPGQRRGRNDRVPGPRVWTQHLVPSLKGSSRTPGLSLIH